MNSMEAEFYTPYEQDVPYGMSNNEPQPMGNMPANQQGYPNLGSPYTNNAMSALGSIRNYAKGGRVSQGGLRSALEALRQSGAGPDKILAHITPEEAQELALRHGGGDINPISGLPQFGWWERMWENIFDKGNDLVERHGESVSRGLASTIGAVGGNMLGGPLGAMLGGALFGGGFEGMNQGNVGRGILTGGAHGAAHGFLGPALGRGLGLSPSGPAGTMLGMSPRADMLGGLTSMLGLGGMGGGSGGGMGSVAGRAGMGMHGASGGGGGGLSSMFGNLLGGGGGEGGGSGMLGNLGGSGGLLNLGLLGAALLGGLNAKKETPHEKSVAEHVAQNRPQWGPEHQPRELRPYERSLRYFDPNVFRPGAEPEMLYFQGPGYVEPRRLAKGGHLFEGDAGGQSDRIPTDLQNGDYIGNASDVSDAGDGNPEAGVKNIMGGLQSIASKKHYKKGGNVPRGTVKALVSPKEMRIPKDLVTAVGHGDNDKGAKTIKGMFNKLRKQKRSNPKSLPPKAKPFQKYAGGK